MAPIKTVDGPEPLPPRENLTSRAVDKDDVIRLFAIILLDLYQERHLVRGGFQPRLPTSLPPPGQQQQPSPLPRRQPVPLMPPAQLHPGAPQVVAPAPAVPLQSPPPSELMDVDPSAGPPSQAVAVQPVLQPLSLGTPKESDTAAPCPAPTPQPSTQRQGTLPLFVGPDAPSRPVPEAAPVVTGMNEIYTGKERRKKKKKAAAVLAGYEVLYQLAQLASI
ncbi:proline-rich protein 2-like [Schistocerca americana]|uniref:proline-rich protein 2-like n=1 Tax=Schistocerca americana TaxID=7009 RepID=UPI001F4F3412|nr:proline-rich protein 2-like [Schistocerca americana]